ncbi:hypothetical protein [Nocardia sp. CC227C]|uniref:hypothetical protein n=1 Tax=Nocardia sp. CC227C TaxID=3044562 RepID=UPI00278C7511|nr:hypothetical protein [Nocardia sp. CC227C]
MAAVALTAGCGSTTSGSGQPEGSASPSTSSSAPTTTGGATPAAPAQGEPLTVSDSVAQQLCDIIEPQLSDWRVQGPTLGKISLNGSVHEWALRNGAINGRVLGDKDSVDRIMTAQCPDVHAQAVSALELPSLAAGLL